MCKACKDKSWSPDKGERARYRDPTQQGRFERGLCIQCGENKPEEGKVNCPTCIESMKTYYRERLKSGLCAKCCKVPPVDGLRLCETCNEKAKERTRGSNAELKLQAMDGYGGPICSCCGETEIDFLEFDHINNDGSADRKERGVGAEFYRSLIKDGFPDHIQILCSNCNKGKQRNGGYLVQETKAEYLLDGVTPEMREGCWGGSQFTVTGPNQIEMTTPESVVWKVPPSNTGKKTRTKQKITQEELDNLHQSVCTQPQEHVHQPSGSGFAALQEIIDRQPCCTPFGSGFSALASLS